LWGVVRRILQPAEMKAGFIVGSGQLHSSQRAAGELRSEVDDEGGIGTFDVPFRPLEVIELGGFAQVIAGVDLAVLRQASARTPAAVRDAIGDGPVESGAVGTGLAAGNMSWKIHCRRESQSSPI